MEDARALAVDDSAAVLCRLQRVRTVDGGLHVSSPDAAVPRELPATHTDEGLRGAIDIRRKCPGTGGCCFSQYIGTLVESTLGLAASEDAKRRVPTGLRHPGACAADAWMGC